MSSAGAGWILTTFAIAYAIGSPLLVALTGSWERRNVLLLGLVVFTLATAASALSLNTPMLLSSRIAVAVGASLITPVTAAIAVAVSPPEKIGKSLAAVFFGLTLSQAIGLPVGSFVAYTFGWQAAFAVVVLLGILSLAGVAWVVPTGLPFKPNSLKTLGASLVDWRRLSVVLFIASFLGAIYVMYTYFAPLLTESMGYGRDGISLLLFVFGFGAVIGNFLGGRLADRFGPMKTLVGICVSMIILMPLFSMLPMADGWLIALTLVWSAISWSIAAPQQMRVIQHSPGSESVALALHASSIYIGISLGAVVGGFFVSYTGLMSLGIAGAACVVACLVHLLLSERWAKRSASA